ncbi:hypothetical protein YPPY32_2544, partial [Yersinia pestis PY-32]
MQDTHPAITISKDTRTPAT